MKAVIFDIKRFAVHDGPGIRTTVFLKGCPLRCTWCHNPESQGFGIEELSGGRGTFCVGREISVEEVVRLVERDMVFFDESGGGVTFSGGEPLSQPDFLVKALDACGAMGIHRAVDTSGYASRDVLIDVAARTDLFLYDLKLADESSHLAHTGVEAALIRENLIALCGTGVAIELRMPMIPGINDSDACLDSMKEFIDSLPRRLPVKLLPYHSAAMDKYSRFGMKVPLPHTKDPSAGRMAYYNSKMCSDQLSSNLLIK